METTKDLMRASVAGEELVEEGLKLGVEKGIEQGMERGRMESTRRHIRSLLASRVFGSIDDIGRLDSLFDEFAYRA